MSAGNTEQYMPSKTITFLGTLAKTASARKKELEQLEAQKHAQGYEILRAILPTVITQQGLTARHRETTALQRQKFGFDVEYSLKQLGLQERQLAQEITSAQAKLDAAIAAREDTQEHEIELAERRERHDRTKLLLTKTLQGDADALAFLRDMSKAAFTAGQAMKRTEADIAGRKAVAQMRIDALKEAAKETRDPEIASAFRLLQAMALNEEEWLETLDTSPDLLPFYEQHLAAQRGLQRFINAGRAAEGRPPIPDVTGIDVKVDVDKWMGPIPRQMPILGGGVKKTIVPAKKPAAALPGLISPPKQKAIEEPPIPFRFADQREKFVKALDELSAMSESEFNKAWAAQGEQLELNDNEREAIKNYILKRIRER